MTAATTQPLTIYRCPHCNQSTSTVSASATVQHRCPMNRGQMTSWKKEEE